MHERKSYALYMYSQCYVASKHEISNCFKYCEYLIISIILLFPFYWFIKSHLTETLFYFSMRFVSLFHAIYRRRQVLPMMNCGRFIAHYRIHCINTKYNALHTLCIHASDSIRPLCNFCRALHPYMLVYPGPYIHNAATRQRERTTTRNIC